MSRCVFPLAFFFFGIDVWLIFFSLLFFFTCMYTCKVRQC